jgi:AraC-like DNA-binding protein
MNFARLNPLVRSVGLYEVINNSEPHRAYDSRLIYMISGDMTVTLDDSKFRLAPGNLLYIPAGTTYRLRGEYLRAVAIALDLTDNWCDEEECIPPAAVSDFSEEKCHRVDIHPFDRVLYVEDFESERDTFIRMDAIATSGEGEWRSVISAMLKLILIRVSESVSDNALPSRMVESLDAYIRENASEEISNTEIGAIFGYHPFYVSRVVKEKKGVTLRQYIISYRLRLASRLLRLTKKSIAEISEVCGFTDASYFTKIFRQHFGMTPKEWRGKFKEEFI